MQYIKDRYLDTDIHIVLQGDEKIGLAQSDKLYKLSLFNYNGFKPKAIINCSYFYTENGTPFAVGREQGDLKNQRTDNDGIVFVHYQNKWDIGYFKSWDYVEGVDAGFSVATLLIKDGKDVEEVSSIISDAKTKLTTKAPQTCVGITNDNKLLMLVSEGRNANDKGLTGLEVRTYLKARYSLKYLGQADGGGSSEMIVEGQIKNQLSDGSERPMLNGLCLYNESKPFKPTIPNVKIMFPCQEGWDSQAYSSKHTALDFGWLSSQSKNGKTPILACDDGEVVFEGFYKQNFGSGDFYPIGVILKHHWSDESDYYSIYWHLSSSIVNIGDKVKKGQQIGTKGNTGISQGVHLHWQIINIPKGMEVPNQHNADNWTQYSINPTNITEVYSNQVWKSVGNFDLALHKEDEDVEELKKQIIKLTAEVDNLKTTLQEKTEIIEKVRSIVL